MRPFFIFRFLAGCLLYFGVSNATDLVQTDTSFLLGDFDTQVQQALEAIVSRQYNEASRLAKNIPAKASCVIEGMVQIGRYDDLGDTLALQNGVRHLNRCKADGYWDALRIFELGYAQSELGHSLKGAMNTRAAAKIFKSSKNSDAQAFYAIYAYYMDETFSWLPFVSDARPEYIKILENAALHSKLFWPLFTTSLVWMYYDNADYAKALSLIENGLLRAPNHPVFLQIKADMLYRQKKYKEAANIYEKSANDYLKRTGKSIRYWCAAANLLRIYADMQNDKYKERQNELRSKEFNAIKHWMPKSLMDDLKKKKLF